MKSKTSTAKKSRWEFVKLPIQAVERMHELTGAEWKVWCAYLKHANPEDGRAWPGRETIQALAGLDLDWISRARSGLEKKRWLVLVGKKQGAGGRFCVPVFRVQVPHRAVVSPARRKSANRAVVSTVHRAVVSTAGSRASRTRARGRRASSPGFAGLRPAVLPTKKEANLRKNLERKMLAAGDQAIGAYLRGSADEERAASLWANAERAFALMRYRPDIDNPLVGAGFVTRAVDAWEEHAGERLLPGILCSRVIDLCVEDGVTWPPDFAAHRDRLRKEERKLEEVEAK